MNPPTAKVQQLPIVFFFDISSHLPPNHTNTSRPKPLETASFVKKFRAMHLQSKDFHVPARAVAILPSCVAESLPPQPSLVLKTHQADFRSHHHLIQFLLHHRHQQQQQQQQQPSLVHHFFIPSGVLHRPLAHLIEPWRRVAAHLFFSSARTERHWFPTMEISVGNHMVLQGQSITWPFWGGGFGDFRDSIFFGFQEVLLNQSLKS